MARRSPSRIQVTCSTTGNGPFTLVDGVPAATGYRTIAHAVADGSLVNGDEILFHMVDQAAAGNQKMMWTGAGTLNTTTLVLTVTQTYEKSALLTSGGGWGAGTRDVSISPPGAWNTAFKDLANEFSQDQSIDKADAAWNLKLAGVVRARLLHSANIAYHQSFTSGAVNNGSLAITGGLSYSLDGVTYKTVPTLESGNKVVQFPGGGVTKLVFYQAAAPLGWTKDTSQNDKALRVVSGTGGGSGGSRALSSTVVGSTSAPLLEHKHTISYGVTSVVTGAGVFALVSLGSGAGSADTANTGIPAGSDSHNHDLSLAYIDVIVCSLD